MKITIFYKFRDGAWGGANQFLKALRIYFIGLGCYVDDPFKADVILFVSYPGDSEELFRKVMKLKKRKKNLIVLNRMNGPIALYRDTGIEVDKINFNFNHNVADGTIYQSKWSQEQCHAMGMKKNRYESVIMNSPDSNIFYPPDLRSNTIVDRKIKLMAASWSSNIKKGFDVYEFLDKNLDHSRYEMTFVGNTPYNFKHIKHILPLSSNELASQLRENDIFIFASKLETCSNSLLEAIHCGLPVVARDNSSQPEAIGKGGELFEDTGDVLDKIDTVAENIKYYKNSIKINDTSEIGSSYLKFCKTLYEDVREGKYTPKKWGYPEYLALLSSAYWWKYKSKIKAKLATVFN